MKIVLYLHIAAAAAAAAAVVAAVAVVAAATAEVAIGEDDVSVRVVAHTPSERENRSAHT